ncbi:MAG: YhgE/Pip family protein, partial [Salinibacterium sp.]|nr:YhgE/Pip family protein [Salinibacterium sp.]
MNTSQRPKWRGAWTPVARLAALALVPLAVVALFVGAVGQTDSAIDRIPAAIVNEDRLIMSTAADGTEQPVFAGRLLVTELTGAEGFDWTITNEKDAEAALANGEVYAILTIPSNFSRSILSLSGQSPEQADIAIRTDDAHGYLTGSVAQV